MLSGGKDSGACCQALSEKGLLQGCVALKTKICTPDWEAHVIKTCADRGWPLEFYETNEEYDLLVEKYGFPGPSKHGWFMNYLKGRGVAKFKKAHPDAILASGVRANESQRRKINTKPVGMWEGVPILAPIFHWTTDETWAYFRDRGLERSPAYSTLQISGDCLCGAYAQEGEREAINFHYPKLGAHLTALGESIKDKHPTRCEWGWGWGWKQERKPKTAKQAMLCVECGDTQLDLFYEQPIAA